MLDCWLHIHVGYWRTGWSETSMVSHANLFFALPEYWLIIRLMLSDDLKQIVTLPRPSKVILINSGRLARELSGFKSNWPSQHELSYMFTMDVKHQLYKETKGGYLFPCFPKINWLVPLFLKNRKLVLLWVCYFPIGILGQVWNLIVLIPDLCPLSYFSYVPCSPLLSLFSSKLGLCSSLPLK